MSAAIFCRSRATRCAFRQVSEIFGNLINRLEGGESLTNGCDADCDKRDTTNEHDTGDRSGERDKHFAAEHVLEVAEHLVRDWMG